MVIKSREYKQGLCKLDYLQRDVDNLFNRERILSKVKVFPKKYKKARVKYPDLLKKIVYTTKLSEFKSVLIQSSHFKIRSQNLLRRDQTGTFLLRIRLPVCKRQNEYGTKSFSDSLRIRKNLLYYKPRLGLH